MTTANDARRAHDLLDELDARAELSEEQEKLLRSFLPERPKDATLDDLLARVHAAWISANPSYWGFDTPAEHHDWLFDLRNDLIHIIEEQDAPVAVPALPAGMRLAEHEKYGRVVVSTTAGKSGNYMIFILDNSNGWGSSCTYADCSSLTFIDAPPAHPEFLETEADYENAPVGTIVAKDNQRPAWKPNENWFINNNPFDNREMAGGFNPAPSRVLRWGLGE